MRADSHPLCRQLDMGSAALFAILSPLPAHGIIDLPSAPSIGHRHRIISLRRTRNRGQLRQFNEKNRSPGGRAIGSRAIARTAVRWSRIDALRHLPRGSGGFRRLWRTWLRRFFRHADRKNSKRRRRCMVPGTVAIPGLAIRSPDRARLAIRKLAPR